MQEPERRLSTGQVWDRVIITWLVAIPLFIWRAWCAGQSGQLWLALAIAFSAGVVWCVGLAWVGELLYRWCSNGEEETEIRLSRSDFTGEGPWTYCYVNRCKHCGHEWIYAKEGEPGECPECRR